MDNPTLNMCLTCGHKWKEPTPSGRCPKEDEHEDEDEILTPWEDAARDAVDAAEAAFRYSLANDENIDEDAGSDAAHEWADGCQHVIYTGRSRDIWMSSEYVREMEDEAEELCEHRPGIDTLITMCVYLALREKFQEAWNNLYHQHEESNL